MTEPPEPAAVPAICPVCEVPMTYREVPFTVPDGVVMDFPPGTDVIGDQWTCPEAGEAHHRGGYIRLPGTERPAQAEAALALQQQEE